VLPPPLPLLLLLLLLLLPSLRSLLLLPPLLPMPLLLAWIWGSMLLLSLSSCWHVTDSRTRAPATPRAAHTGGSACCAHRPSVAS
jgi:hypothetical protein